MALPFALLNPMNWRRGYTADRALLTNKSEYLHDLETNSIVYLDDAMVEQEIGGAGMTSFTLAGDSGTPQTIEDGNTLTIEGGTGIDTVAGATDKVTVNIDSTVVTLTGTQVLTNKTFTDNVTTFQDQTDNTKKFQFDANLITAGATRTMAAPNASGTIVLTTATQTLQNKSLNDNDCQFVDNADVSKQMQFQLSGITTGNTRVLTVPDANLTIVGLDTTQTLTNKTLTAPTMADFTNANHDHLDADDGGTLSAAAIASGTLVHERGGLEADVSAYDGLTYITGGATSAVALPQRASLSMLEITSTAGTYTITPTVATGMYMNFLTKQASAADAADGDAFSLSFWLKAGTYTMSVLGQHEVNNGKIDWKIDGSTVVSGQDWYAAATANNIIKTASVTVSGNGYHKLDGVINGKNASSSDFLFRLTWIWFKPASD